MLNVYCIPGMGVDGRLFKNLQINNAKIHHIKWLTPLKNEQMREYAIRLSEQIDTSEPFVLVGVSFGGMCSVEIAKYLNPVKTFVISSCKKSNELPLKINFWKNFSLYRKLSDAIYIKGAMLVKKQFGVTTKDQSDKFLEMLKSAPENYFSGAVHCIMNWKNDIIPDGIIHIHGTADRVLPHKKINCDYKLVGGDHFMIVTRAREINEIIKKELEEIL
jgi:surfactin synthase thioesterase subunit